jgi:N-acyl-L-homoserine lactone synthetase
MELPVIQSHHKGLAIKPEWFISSVLIMDDNTKIYLDNVLDISGQNLTVETLNKVDSFRNAKYVQVFLKGELLGERLIRLEYEENSEDKRRLKFNYEDKNYCTPFSNRLVKVCGDNLIPVNDSDIKQIIMVLLNKEEDIKISVVNESDELEKIYKFRYKQYYELGKITEEIFPGCRLVDKLDSCSTIIMASIHGIIVGTVRLTCDDAADMFEVESDYGEKIREKGVKYAEVSRFCIDKYFRGAFNSKNNLYARLFLEIYRFCIQNDVEKLVCTSLKAHTPIYSKFGFISTGKEIKMELFKYNYFIMEAKPHYSVIKELDLQELFKEVYFEEIQKQYKGDK